MIYYIRNSKTEKAVQSYEKIFFNSIPPPVHYYYFYFLLTLTNISFQDCKVFHGVFIVIRRTLRVKKLFKSKRVKK